MSPGDFIWHELRTGRPAEAAEFYAELFGWQAASDLTADGEFVMYADGMPAARLRALADRLASQWLPGIEVADLDTAVEWATAHRATLRPQAAGRCGPRDSSAAISHPSAGDVLLIRPGRESIATGKAFDWHLLDTPDLDDAAWSYGVLAGWVATLVAPEPTAIDNQSRSASEPRQRTAAPIRESPEDPSATENCLPYEKTAIVRGRTARAVATFTLAPGAVSPAWLPYKKVDDIDKAARRTVELGGSLITEFSDLPPIGTSCLLRDPAGIPFACFQQA